MVNLILFYFPRDLQAKKFFSDLFFLPHPTLSPLSPLPPHSRPFPASYLSLFSIHTPVRGFGPKVFLGGGKESRHVKREVGHRYHGFSCRSTRTQTETEDVRPIYSLASRAGCSYDSKNPTSNTNLTSRAPEWLRNLIARSAIFWTPDRNHEICCNLLQSRAKSPLDDEQT